MGVRNDLVRSFRWVDGHADVWRWFSDGELFRKIGGELADPFRDIGVTKVAAIEARGFDKIRSIVEVDLVDGRTLTQASDDRYRGGPEKPFTREELHAKFADCAAPVLEPGRIRQALETIESVERLKTAGALVSALGGQ